MWDAGPHFRWAHLAWGLPPLALAAAATLVLFVSAWQRGRLAIPVRTAWLWTAALLAGASSAAVAFAAVAAGPPGWDRRLAEAAQHLGSRSEERRVGKECRSRWPPEQ